MSRRLYDFVCGTCNSTTEYFVEDNIYARNCDLNSRCQQTNAIARRKISAPTIKLESISGDFPGATLKWERARPPKTQAQVERHAAEKAEKAESN